MSIDKIKKIYFFFLDFNLLIIYNPIITERIIWKTINILQLLIMLKNIKSIFQEMQNGIAYADTLQAKVEIIA